MKILLIEDIRIERKKIRKWLEEIGCEVVEASNGVEGLECFNTNRPDLVITDMVMPEKEGVEVMIELRRASPDIKIFAMSGAGRSKSGEYLPLAKGLGALRTFAKPIEKGELLDAIREFFPAGC